MINNITMNIAIIEDDDSHSKMLHDILDTWDSFHCLNIKRYYDVDSAIQDMDYLIGADIFFLDVVLPSISGIQFAQMLRESGYNNMIVFTSQYLKFSTIGYYVDAFRYCQKPLMENEILECVGYAYDLKKGEYLSLSIKNRLIQIRFDQITHISSLDHVITINTNKRNFEIRKPLRELLHVLPGCFVQCNRSYIVNTNFILSLIGKQLTMFDGTCITVARNKFTELILLLDSKTSIKKNAGSR